MADDTIGEGASERRRLRRGGGRPTIADVARLADVAPITVSRALRAPGAVSAELRERIDAAVARLGYEPDPAARALASARSEVVGVVVPSLTNIVFNEVLSGIYDRLGQGALQVRIANTHYSPLEEERLLRAFLTQRPAALIVAGVDQSPASRELLKQTGCPVVQIMELSDDPVDMLVGFSQIEGGRAATAHLIESGYRRIGFLGAQMDPRSQRRLEGYRSRMATAGLYDPALVTTTTAPSSVPLGRELLRQALGETPDLDAVFCNNDDLAMGVLFECLSRGLRVPDQIGICGFNDLDMMAAACPALTSVATPRYEIGRQSVEMILARLAGVPEGPPVRDLGFELRARRSTLR